MEYQIAHAPSIGSLEKIVADMIIRGWRPCGGLSAIKSDGSSQNTYSQAMTRETTNDHN
jgi:hypothetical protein